jgi:hypothetical protein
MGNFRLQLCVSLWFRVRVRVGVRARARLKLVECKFSTERLTHECCINEGPSQNYVGKSVRIQYPAQVLKYTY